jgi:AraC family transcriptional regulator
MSATIGAGQFVSWDGGCLFISRRASRIVPLHAHYAIQIAFGSEHGLRFRADDGEPWTEYHGVVIASRQPHSMDSTVVPFNAVLFVDPETREGRALQERFTESGFHPLSAEQLDAVRSALFAAWLEEGSEAAVAAASRSVIRALTGGVVPSVVTDERILRATAYIRGHLDAPVSLEQVAEIACLSPSRFRHLFVEETGMALRSYILWRRFLLVWDMLTSGATLSAAAHAAGFADAAHLTRTSRQVFGFPPSALLVAEAPRAGAAGEPLPSTT